MPIRKSDYPPDWDAISLRIRVDRAGNCCERCGVRNHAIIRRYRSTYEYATGCDLLELAYVRTFRFRLWWCLKYLGLTKVILTVAHLDRNPANNEEGNLRALCQRCHLGYDMPQHVRNQKYGRDHDRKHQLTIFSAKTHE